MKIKMKNKIGEELSLLFVNLTLYGWDDRKFEKEYLRKLERNFEGGVISESKTVDSNYFILFSYFSFSFILFLFLET